MCDTGADSEPGEADSGGEPEEKNLGQRGYGEYHDTGLLNSLIMFSVSLFFSPISPQHFSVFLLKS